MIANLVGIHGVRVLQIEPDGPELRSDRDAVALIGDALGSQVEMVLLPVSRLDDTFFDLSTRLAGEFVQKFVNYGIRLVIIGDISQHTAESKSLREFAYEANRGDRIWFMPSREMFEHRLVGAPEIRR